MENFYPIKKKFKNIHAFPHKNLQLKKNKIFQSELKIFHIELKNKCAIHKKFYLIRNHTLHLEIVNCLGFLIPPF